MSTDHDAKLAAAYRGLEDRVMDLGRVSEIAMQQAIETANATIGSTQHTRCCELTYTAMEILNAKCRELEAHYAMAFADESTIAALYASHASEPASDVRKEIRDRILSTPATTLADFAIKAELVTVACDLTGAETDATATPTEQATARLLAEIMQAGKAVRT